ncbi:MAG: protease inhibitor I42 family protein [Anaerolineales bacterium]
MFKITQFLTVLTGVCLLLTACGGAIPGAEGNTVVITPAIKGNSASLNVGDTLEIQIPTIPTAGYEWEAQDLDTSILIQEGSALYMEDSSPNSAGGIVTLRFNAVGAGNTTLNLLYVNSSVSGDLSLSKNSFSVTVEVK